MNNFLGISKANLCASRIILKYSRANYVCNDFLPRNSRRQLSSITSISHILQRRSTCQRHFTAQSWNNKGEKSRKLNRKILTSFEHGYPFGKETIVFIAGFPDNEVSGWGKLVDMVKAYTDEKKNIQAIFMCLPDYEDNASPKPWGYNFDETVSLIKSTIDYYVPDKTKKVNLVIHDWGSYMGYLFENKYPERVKRLISVDVGMQAMPKKKYQVFLLTLYQWWFAMTYVISQSISYSLGQALFKLYFYLPNVFKISPSMPRDSRQVTVAMSYLYYYFWKDYFLNRKNLPLPKFPTCPMLFIYGTNKPVMLHSDKFIKLLENKPDCSYKSVNAGHWVAYDAPEVVFDEIKNFFKV